MKAIYFDEAGEPQNVLALKEVDKPTPGKEEVRIKVLASPVLPADMLFVKGVYRIKPVFPQIAGLEAAGIVDSVGENVNVSVGSLVAFLYKNAWAEYVVVPKQELFVLPKGFPIEKAAQFTVNPVTAWGLLQEAQTKEADWLLLTAGTSAIAKIVTQIAKLKGIKVILAVRNLEHADELKTLGADEVINYLDNSWTEQVMKITNGKGVEAAMDAVGGKTGTELISLIDTNGRIIIYGLLSPDKTEFHYSSVIYKQLTLRGFGIRNFLTQQSTEERQKMTNALIDILGNKNFQLPVFATYQPEDFKATIESSNNNAAKGKTLISFSAQ